MRNKLNFPALLVLAFALSFNGAQANSPDKPCLTGYQGVAETDSPQPANRKMSVRALKNKVDAYGRSMSNELADQAMQELHDRSDALRAALQARPNDPAVVSYHTISVGGGMHNAILEANLPQNGKHLTVEGSDRLIHTFRAPGPTFRINSPELPNASANAFSGEKFPLKKLADGKFVKAEALADKFELEAYATNAEPLLETRAHAVEDLGEEGAKKLGRLKVNLQGTNPVFGDKVFLAPGLGEQSFGLKDPASLALIKAEAQKAPSNPNRVPGIQHFDEAMEAAANRIKRGASFTAPYKDKVVAVVGSGDGANVFVEGLNGPDGKPKKILWLAQKATDPESYKKANKARYHDTLANLFGTEGSIMEPAPDHLVGVAKTSAPDGSVRYQMQLEKKLADGTVQKSVMEADQLVFATGYKNKVEDMLSKLPEHKFVDVVGPLKPGGPDTILAREVQYTDGTKPGIFIYGPAAGDLATEEELMASITHNPVSLNVLGDRTAALARQTQITGPAKAPFCADGLCTNKAPQ